MGMNQVYVSPLASPVSKRIRARLYPADRQVPLSVSSYYRGDPTQRYVLALDTLSGAKTQPYVHDVVVSVTYRRKAYKFRVFFKRHKLLPINQAVRQLAGIDVEGDVLVVAVGKKVNIRNLRGREENRAADLALRRLMQRLTPLRTRPTFPAKMTV
ncbi:hypothetical protein K435DRAFT_854751 [Dendrothele bispora CBS 962.96]|uniref:Uncharacterized protein n=1 Tax=Dendrothele bispora (strain CBS 962.96) TaxID=1314807 RepID=A0A4S8MCY7_DENBC|nr:hypothetical protein K435DRAFT_854751 [Dendrothele bispora CBS 962.96]